MSSVRGAHYLFFAKAYFVATGYLIYAGLARILTPSEFGRYGVVIGIVSVVNMMFVTGTVQTVSRFVSRCGGAGPVLGNARRLHTILGGAVFALLIAGSGALARFLNDAGLGAPIRIAAFIVLAYAFYSVHIGVLNGLRRFRAQGFFDVSFSTAKAALVLTLGAAAASTGGAVAGFSAAAIGIALVSAAVVRGGAPGTGETVPMGRLFVFQIAVMGFAFLLNLVMNADLFLVKKFAGPLPDGAEPGFYTAALAIARVPMMLLAPVGSVVLPLFSRAESVSAGGETAGIIRRAVRVCLAVALPAACFVAANAQDFVGLLYPDRYAPAAEALRILGPAYAALAVFSVSATVVTSGGRPALSLIFGALVLLLQVSLGVLWIPDSGIIGAARASLAAFGAGAAAIAFFLRARYGGFASFWSSARIAAASAAVYAGGAALALKGLWLGAEALVLGALYAALLFILRETSADELRGMKRLWSKESASRS